MARKKPSPATPTHSDYDPTPIRLAGSDSDFIYWHTQSWTKRRKDGKVIEYDISLDKRDGLITCSCPDAQYRGKVGDVLDLKKPHKCKHVSKLCHTLGAVLAPSPRPSSTKQAQNASVASDGGPGGEGKENG